MNEWRVRSKERKCLKKNKWERKKGKMYEEKEQTHTHTHTLKITATRG